MNVNKKYVIYELNSVMGCEKHKALERVILSGYKTNGFETEDEAIISLIEDEKTYKDFVILKEVYITA